MLQIIIKEKIFIQNASTALKAAVTKALTVDNPEYTKRKKRGISTWNIPKYVKLYSQRMDDILAPRGFLPELKTILEKQGIDTKRVLVDERIDGLSVDFGEWNSKFHMKEDQKPFVEAALEQNGIGVAPAGTGKTVMGLRYIFKKGRCALWITHTKDLMYQTKKSAEEVMPCIGRIGILGDGRKDFGDGKLIIATVQTLQRSSKLIDDLKKVVGTIVIDEAHHFPSPQFLDTVAKFPAKNVIGLTATPHRKDQMEVMMFAGIGPVFYQIKRDGLYEAGRLIKPEIRFVYTNFEHSQASNRNDIDSVDAGGEDMDFNELKDELINDEERANLLAQNIVDAACHGMSIVITESVRYCFILQEKVRKLAKKRIGKELKTAVVHGGLSRYKWIVARNEDHAKRSYQNGEALDYKKVENRWKIKVENYTEQEFRDWQVTKTERADILEAAQNKQLDILFATQLAREGLNIPHLTVGHMAMPKRGDAQGTTNGSAVEQEIGRIMRPDPDNPNKKALWFDYVDYNVGVLKSQYYSRRKVYQRLQLKLPRKQSSAKEIEKFLESMPW